MTAQKSNIYHFNPTCEYAVGNGNASWQPNLLLRKMESDLALLPTYFSKSSDYLLINEKPSVQFYDYLNRLEIQIPNFLFNPMLINFNKSHFEIERLLPWGWSPAEHKLLEPLKDHCSSTFRKSPVFQWKPEHRNLYSKKFALEILQKLISEIDSGYIIKPEYTAKVCYSKSEIEELLKKWGNLMIKAPWSSSGRGLQPITKVPVHTKVWEKISGILRDQGYVLVEPLLNKASDLAFQFELEKGQIKYLGISNFTTDQKGQYQGNYLNGLPPELFPEIKEFILKIPELVVAPLIKALEDSELAIHYEGNFGVDTLVYFDENQNLKINPCLEINLRQNMGLLSLQLEQLIYPAKKGIFRTYYNPKKSFTEFVHEMENKFPLKVVTRKIKNGFFPLTDFNENTMFGAYILVI